jgi:flagellar protein FlaI
MFEIKKKNVELKKAASSTQAPTLPADKQKQDGEKKAMSSVQQARPGLGNETKVVVEALKKLGGSSVQVPPSPDKTLHQESGKGFQLPLLSLFGKKARIEEIKKKLGPEHILAPITADQAILESAQSQITERYPIREPVIYVSISRDEIGSPIYLIEEPVLTEEENIVYNQLMDILQYELKAPYDGAKTDPKEYFDKEAKRIITKYALSMGVTPSVTWNKVYYYITRDMVGFGPLEAIMRDPNIEDVSIDGVEKNVYVWHKKYDSLKTNLIFKSEKELDDTIIRLVHTSGKHISTAYPIVDATLPGRHRLVATFRREVSRYGSTATIRKFREDPFTVVDLLNFKTLNHEMAAYSWLLMEHNVSSIIVGSTASGKTTLLNSLVSMTRPSSKIITIEETQEINIHHQNWVPLVSRIGYGIGSEKIGEVALFDLVKASMRMRPDILIVGEVRGEEAFVLFQAISTGHGGMCTLHADDVESAVQRLTSKPMDVAPIHMKFLDLMFVVRNTSVTNPQTKKTFKSRRVLALTEILDYNKYNQIFEWDPYTDTHILSKGSLQHSEKLKVIGKDTGRTVDELIEEIKRREVILTWLQKKDVRNFKELGRIFEKYQEKKDAFLAEIRAELNTRKDSGRIQNK